jgi:hypothetical protein
MLSVLIQSVVGLSFVMLSVIMLRAVASYLQSASATFLVMKMGMKGMTMRQNTINLNIFK